MTPRQYLIQAETTDGLVGLAARQHIVPGSSAVVLFAHGLGCVKESFDEAFTHPALAEFSLMSFDFPGHGGSPASPTREYSLPGLSRILVALTQQFSQPIILVGHSMGGAVAVLAASEVASLVGIVNVEGNLVKSDGSIASRGIAKQPEHEWIQTGFSDFLATLQSSDQQAVQTWSHWMELADPTVIHQLARSLVEFSDSEQLLGRFLALPNRHYVHGDRSANHDLLPQLNDTVITCVPDSGHFPMLDNLDYFYSTVGEIVTTTLCRR